MYAVQTVGIGFANQLPGEWGSVPVKKAKAKVTKAKKETVIPLVPLETEETVETEETETVQKPVRKAKGKAKKAVE